MNDLLETIKFGTGDKSIYVSITNNDLVTFKSKYMINRTFHVKNIIEIRKKTATFEKRGHLFVIDETKEIAVVKYGYFEEQKINAFIDSLNNVRFGLDLPSIELVLGI